LDCQTLVGEIAELNAALGPDVDVAPTKASRNAEELVGEAVRGAVGLPFRGVVRRVTGAEAHDRQLRRAVTAAVARRGFLRGVALGRDCTAPPAG
ncbi:MAG TPA: hypothetical protein VFN88_04760, partial [Caulobacteraceae bacterium]|nr:hypothetical protein [Caulobacteraceae bacterium]